jgi:hypothetical protein
MSFVPILDRALSVIFCDLRRLDGVYGDVANLTSAEPVKSKGGYTYSTIVMFVLTAC